MIGSKNQTVWMSKTWYGPCVLLVVKHDKKAIFCFFLDFFSRS